MKIHTYMRKRPCSRKSSMPGQPTSSSWGRFLSCTRRRRSPTPAPPSPSRRRSSWLRHSLSPGDRALLLALVWKRISEFGFWSEPKIDELKFDAKNLVVRFWLRWSGVKNGGQRFGICDEARSLMHQDNGVPSQQHRPTEETAKLENTTASNGKSSSAPSAPSSNQSSTAQSALASQTTSGSVSRDKRSLEVSRRRRQSSAKSTTSSSSSSVGKLDSSKDANQSAVGHFWY